MFMVVRKSDRVAKKFADKTEVPADVHETLQHMSLDVIEVTDYVEQGKASFNRVYEIYDGIMQVVINEQHIDLQKGDSIFIEKDMNYEIKGTFKAIAISNAAG
jgi:mannose-6-phosphate isomerase class I